MSDISNAMYAVERFVSKNIDALFNSFFFVRRRKINPEDRFSDQVDFYQSLYGWSKEIEDEFVGFVIEKGHLFSELKFIDGSIVYVDRDAGEVHFWVSEKTFCHDWYLNNGISVSSAQELEEVLTYREDSNWYSI